MKRWLMLPAAIAAFTAFAPMSSNAQIAVEVPGVGVRVGEPAPPPRERIIEREVRGGSSECRTVTVQEETPYGTRTVTRKKCD